MMLWPDARRSPSVGTDGATPTPSTDTHATGRRRGFVKAVQEAQAALERERDSAHVVVTTGRASAGTCVNAAGKVSTGVARQQQRRIHQGDLRFEPRALLGGRQARSQRAASLLVTSTGSRSTTTRATTSGTAPDGTGLPPTIDADSCTGDAGSPDDCPLS